MRDVPDGWLYAQVEPDLPRDLADLAEALCWPGSRLDEGLAELARRSGLQSGTPPADSTPAPAASGPGFARWLDWFADQRGLEAEAVDARAMETEEMLAVSAPCLVLHPGPDRSGGLLVLGAQGSRLRILAPDHTVRTCRAADLARLLRFRLEAPLVPEADRVLAAMDVSPRRRLAMRDALIRERLSEDRIGGAFMLRRPPGADFGRQLLESGALRKLTAIVAALAGLYALEIGGWALIGGGSLSGRLDFGLLAGWLLMVVTLPPLKLAGGWIESVFAMDAGRLMKSRLMSGALSAPADLVAGDGVGRLLGRMIEAQALESLVLGGALKLVAAVLELAFAAWVLAHGAAGAPHLLALALWLGVVAMAALAQHRQVREWSVARLDMTNSLIEAMVGHRTRLAQEIPATRDAEDDLALQSYLDLSRRMDQTEVMAGAGLKYGWMVCGLLGLAPALLAGDAPAATAVAVSLGGLMLAQRAMAGLAGGLASVSRAVVAWDQVAPLFRAGGRAAARRPYLDHVDKPGAGSPSPVLDAQGLRFAYGLGGRPVVDGADLSVRIGDRLLLEGGSGSGKSTLAALLTGLQTPDSGLLLLNGMDRHTLGDDWRRFVACAPQFHDNHILSGPLAFNLLMGRAWPPSEKDLADAEAVCEELGLGDLIRRMPGGMMQPVGETGWQLSHGERSRIFLARALLQGVQLAIMDESYAALDPATLNQCLEASWRRAPALMVVAHP